MPETKEKEVVETETESKEKYAIITMSGNKIYLDKKRVQEYIAGGQELENYEYNNFFQLCREYKVNPFLKEAYLIKFKGSPATIVLDYKVLQRIAENNADYDGMEHGTVVQDKSGNLVERDGDFVLAGETLVGGWCKVYRKGHRVPTKCVAMLSEFDKKQGNWLKSPTFMIVKVAKAHALREAFPNTFGSNMYSSDEISADDLRPENEVKEAKSTRKTKISNKIEMPDEDKTKVKEEKIVDVETTEPVKEEEQKEFPFDENGVVQK